MSLNCIVHTQHGSETDGRFLFVTPLLSRQMEHLLRCSTDTKFCIYSESGTLQITLNEQHQIYKMWVGPCSIYMWGRDLALTSFPFHIPLFTDTLIFAINCFSECGYPKFWGPCWA